MFASTDYMDLSTKSSSVNMGYRTRGEQETKANFQTFKAKEMVLERRHKLRNKNMEKAKQYWT